jgi:hypothetical protein
MPEGVLIFGPHKWNSKPLLLIPIEQHGVLGKKHIGRMGPQSITSDIDADSLTITTCTGLLCTRHLKGNCHGRDSTSRRTIAGFMARNHSFSQVHIKPDAAHSIDISLNIVQQVQILEQARINERLLRAGANVCIQQRSMGEVCGEPTSNNRGHSA